jgi:hypothetical protein
MGAMATTGHEARSSWVAIGAGLAAAAAFEAVTVPETQNGTLWAASPWKADPYHAAVTLAQLAVPALVLLIVVRLLARHAPGASQRWQQTVRTAAALTALVACTLSIEWIAVAVGANAASRGAWSRPETVALTVVTVLTTTTTALLARCRRRPEPADRRRLDGLGDVLFLCRRVPALGRWATPLAADRLRRRAMTLFTVLSMLVAAAVAAAQSVGEGLTDPLLIAWYFLAMTAAGLVFCLVGNALTGFVARPPRSRRRRTAEASVLAGGLGTLAATAFHAPLWSALSNSPLTPRALLTLTLTTAATTALLPTLTTVVLLRRSPTA